MKFSLLIKGFSTPSGLVDRVLSEKIVISVLIEVKIMKFRVRVFVHSIIRSKNRIYQKGQINKYD